MMIARSIGGGAAKFKAAAAALLAAAVLVTSTGSLAFSNNKLAYAADGTAGICVPETHDLGDDTAVGSMNDTGVATYVGRNFFVGTPTADQNKLNTASGPDGSYAAEIEGLTVVKGDALFHPLKGFFSIGTVAFGSQFIPPANSTVLAVGGENSGFDKVANGSNVKVMAWDSSAGLNQKMTSDKKKQITGYNAKLAGDKTKSWNGTQDSVYPYTYGGNESGVNKPSVDWGQANVLSNVNGTDYTNQTTENATLSAELAKIPQNGAVTVSEAPPFNGYTRYKYDKSQSFNGFTHAEKLLTFTGDGESLLQSFTIDANVLSQIKDSAGVSYWFRNIPENASVVVNVTGTTDGTKNVSFQNGWRFWWGGDAESTIDSSNVKEISNGYVEKDENAEAYAHAAQSIMWNFTGIQSGGTLKIQGGQNTENNDDPAAAMLGSILVPHGSFESHVTTNGRVMVGEDFAMANPTVAKQFNGTNSASIIDMDQERHNLPWNGSTSSECSTITWNKTDSETGDKVTSASGWAVYKTLDGAKKSDSNQLLLTVTDNAGSDLDSAMGTITIGRLNPNADYFIKEISAPGGYQEPDRDKPTIYKIHTTNKGDTANSEVYKVWENNQTVNTLMTNSNIPNKKSGVELFWQKRAGGENGELLAGSVWTLIKKGESGTTDESWDVHDNTATVSRVTIKQNGIKVTGVIALQQHNYVDLTAEVLSDSGATPVQTVRWTTNYPSIATVSNGRVAGIGAGSAIIKACSVSDSTKCATVTVKVTAVAVNSLTVKSGTTELRNNDALTLQVNARTVLDITVDPSNVLYSITSADTSIVSVRNNVLTGVKAGSTTVTVTAGDKSIKLNVTVQAAENPNDYTYVYFHHTENGWTGKIELHYQKNDGSWTNATDRRRLMQASCNGDYVFAKIPKADNGKQFGFKIVGNENSWYGKAGGGNFTFNGGNVVTVANGKQPYAYPSGCSATKPTSLFSNNAQATVKTARYMTGDSSVTLADVTDTNGDATDDTVAALAEAETKTLPDVDTAVGQFEVLNLDAGTYWLTEKTAPDGYTLNKRVYKITITNGVVKWEGSWPSTEDANNGTRFAADDKPSGPGYAISDKPTEVTWYKVDSTNTHKQLTGAQWQLIWTGSTGSMASTTYCVVDGNGDVKANTCTGEKLTDVSKPGGDGTVVSKADGIITLKGLKFGTYTLTETVAPDGYDLSDKKYTFKINQDSTAGAVQISVKTTAGDPTEVTGNKIPNTPGVELPATGGIGTALFLVGGTLTVMVALAGLTISVRRWRR